MADGGSDFVPINDLGGRIPKDVIDSVAQSKADILAGSVVVPLNIEVPVSD